jgi:phosphate transport system permease protein
VNPALRERLVAVAVRVAGVSAIAFVLVIFFFLIQQGVPAVIQVRLPDLLGVRWYPIEDIFGLVPLILGSLVVTLGATLIAVPLGLATAVYIAEVAPRSVREVLKPFIEVMAGLPSVMLGFLGIVILAPELYRWLHLSTGLTAFTGGLLLGWIAIPTIVSVAEDALDAVPRAYRDGALALGANRWQTIWRVTLPAARGGVLTAIMLGIGRAFGETMAVMMVTGNAAVIPSGWGALFQPVRTMTATIAAEMGEVAGGSVHYHVLFLVGILLFLISLAVNLAGASVVFRARTRAERILA